MPYSVEPRLNKPLYNEFLGIMMIRFVPLKVTKPLYGELILTVPWPFVLSSLQCIERLTS